MKRQPVQIITRSHQETERLGKLISRHATPGMLIALTGDLGAGKTTFVRGLARGLRVARPVRSPTFVIETRYRVHGSRIATLYHLDLYRLRSITSGDIGTLTEAVNDRRGLTVLEWADRLPRLPRTALAIKLKNLDQTTRVIRLSGQGLSLRGWKSLAQLALRDAPESRRLNGRASARRRRPSRSR